MFHNSEALERYVSELHVPVLVSNETPLISNLNMVENIALIEEVHCNKSIADAEKKAYGMLQSVGLQEIAYKRVATCNAAEILYVMLLRALMMQTDTIYMKLPHTITVGFKEIRTIINEVQKLMGEKKLFILDLKINAVHYEGCACSIVK